MAVTRRAAPFILVILILVGAAALRVPLLDVPLDRDEGEYAYGARLLLDGVPPFAEAHNMKMPGNSGRRAATRYLHTYPLMEAQPYAREMQRDMVGQIERVRPAFLVYVNVPASWLMKESSDPFVLTWFDAYQQRYYDRVGVVDILSPGFTLYLWDAAAAGYTPRSNVWLAVFKRRDGSANQR